MTAQRTNWFLYVAGLSASLAAFGAGTSFSWTSPILSTLHLNATENPLGHPVTQFEESWICALVNLGAAFGPLLSTLLADRIGRKTSLLYVSLTMICSYLITAFTTTVELYYFARFLIGIGVGATYSITPMYLGEIAEDTNRGLLGVLSPLATASGALFCYVIGPFVSIQYFSLICIIPLLLFWIIFGIFVPESPYFYVMKNANDKAEISLKRLRVNHNFVEKELVVITEAIGNNEKKVFSDLLKSYAFLKGLFIILSLITFQQFSGIMVFLGYLQSILDATGSSVEPQIASIIVGSIRVFICLITSQLIDRFGRRLLLITSMIGIILSTCLLGSYFYLQTNANYVLDLINWLPTVSLMLFMISYNLGIGPVSWTLLGELFPTNVKSLASTITVFISFFNAFLTTLFFPSLLESIGMAISLWIYTGCTIVGLIFVIIFVPETKGLSLIQIQDLLSNGSNRQKSESCNSQIV